MRISTIVLAAAVFVVIGGCSQKDGSADKANVGQQSGDASSSATSNGAQTNQKISASRAPSDKPSQSENSYFPPTAEELAPLRPEYSAELAKVDEPPEMANKPMQVRKPALPAVVNAGSVLRTLGSPEKATHSQRATAINDLLELTKDRELGNIETRSTLYGALATLACIDESEPQTVIGYANYAIGDEGDDDARALRARMYLKIRKFDDALDDLEKIMLHRSGNALAGGGIDPRKDSAPCGWGIADFDAFGANPRALAAKGFYLSTFIAFGAQSKGTVKEEDIRDLYARSAKAWHSPIPHYLFSSLYGLGSQHSLTRAGCIRLSNVPETSACKSYDEDLRQQIRELTMSLVIEPTFAPALATRADLYLTLAQGAHAASKPSRALFELAIKDFTAALAAGSKEKHTLYCDRALAMASIGKYRDAALGYEQGMKYTKNGIEDSPFVYTQLAGLYQQMGRFDDAAETLTHAIMNTSGGGMDVVILFGGIKSFRTLYPEYDLLPDEILAEAVRRRYYPNFPKTWDDSFISSNTASKGKVVTSILPELYVTRGDAYMQAGRKEEALADYNRVKSDVWGDEERFAPRHTYFDESGSRISDMPEPFPAPSATF